MADKITSVISNLDGSYTFGFDFDNGSGILGETYVQLPIPSNGIPYTLETAKAAILPIATIQKAAWIAEIGDLNIVGNVIL